MWSDWNRRFVSAAGGSMCDGPRYPVNDAAKVIPKSPPIVSTCMMAAKGPPQKVPFERDARNPGCAQPNCNYHGVTGQSMHGRGFRRADPTGQRRANEKCRDQRRQRP